MWKRSASTKTQSPAFITTSDIVPANIHCIAGTPSCFKNPDSMVIHKPALVKIKPKGA